MYGWNLIASVVLVCWLQAGPRLCAQTPVELQAPTAESANANVAADSDSAINADQVAELKELAASGDLAEEQKTRAAELAQQALDDLQAVETFRADAAAYAAQMESVSERLQKIEQQIAALENAADPEINADATVSELETERNAAQQRIAGLEKQLGLPSADPTARTARRRAARQVLIDLPNKLQDVKTRLADPPPEGEPAVVTKLRLARLSAERQLLQERANAAQNELSLFDAEDAVGLPTLSWDLFTRQLTRERKLVERYTDRTNQLRQQEADLRVREAREAAMRAQPLLKPILEANEQIALEEAEVRQKHEAVQKSLLALKEQLATLQEDFEDIQNLDKEFGLSASVGLRLRKLRSQLPSLQAHRAEQRTLFKTLEQAQFTLYERTDELDGLGDIETAAAKLASQASGLDDAQRAQLARDALAALRTQHDYLDKVVNAYRNYTDTLTRLDLHEQALIKLTGRFADFIDERVLWVRSHQPLSVSGVLADRGAFSWLGDAAGWQSIGRAVTNDANQVPFLYGSVGALFVFLLVLHRRIGRRLHELTKPTRSRVAVSVRPIVRATEFTLLSAIVWPGLMWFLAWRLWQSPEPARVVLVASASLARLAGVFLLLELMRQSMRPAGLCEAHFGLHAATARRIRQRIRQIMVLVLPLAAVVAVTHFQNGDERQTSVERLFFIAAMLVLAYFAHTFLRRGRGDLRELQAFQGKGWIGQLRFLWYLMAVGAPLLLAGLAAAGYYYSAQELAVRCQISVALLLGLVYLRAFLLRWLMLRHRRLRLQRLRERQHARQAHADHETGAPLPEVPAEETDLESISRQSQRLVGTTFVVACLIGVWMIWFDVVPALRFLDRWPLWEYTVQIREEFTNAEGGVEYRVREVPQAVTIAHVAFAMLISVLTITAARNLPGLLDITLLQRLPIDRSTTYAITALVRYSILLVGIVLANQMLGIGWAKVQWLAAALTFGLGFGLQEIFANFVSGIIILFEQPVRVGDVVTIDGISGVVNRIRIRATTIVDWDRKEYIVPNREFITGRLLNWTLSDKTNRVVIKVGVAYGSDTTLVRETILGAARDHKNVLTDPAPLVTFEGFVDSTLDFVLRAYLPNLDGRLQTVHDLHTAIDDRLKAAGIEIAFPQRDLNVRTPVVLTNNAAVGPDAAGANGHAPPTPPQTADLSPS